MISFLISRIDEDLNGLRYFLSDVAVLACTLVLFIRYRMRNNLYSMLIP